MQVIIILTGNLTNNLLELQLEQVNPSEVPPGAFHSTTEGDSNELLGLAQSDFKLVRTADRSFSASKG